MKLSEFASKHPVEVSCIARLREIKEKGTHICPRCGHVHRYWEMTGFATKARTAITVKASAKVRPWRTPGCHTDNGS